MKEMNGKVAVIVGATSGIGRATALLFAEHKIKIVAAGRNENAGEELINQIIRDGGEGIFVKTDVTNSKSTEALIKSAIDHFGGIDFAFNNAGIEGAAQSIFDMDETNWNQVIDTNLKGMWLCLKYEFFAMRLRGRGVIVNTSTSLTRSGLANTGAYTASKAGVDALTQVAAIEYGGYGIRVNAINPGAVHTPMLQRIYSSNEIEQIRKANPLNNIATSRDVAQTVLWLCSPMASHINGTSIFIDGGASLLCY
ncbi:MAG: SDR family oxidoreductase [Chlamydiales bacterium]|nr:SDR family oxidoreductase [Chlamydiales bacterium]